MIEECYEPGFIQLFLFMYCFFPLMFVFPTWIVAKFIYEPMLNRIEIDNKMWKEYLAAEKEKIPYHLKYKLTADVSNCETKITDFISEETPEGMVIMRYNTDEEGFEYWADTAINYLNLETVALKYVNAFNCGGIYVDRKKLLKEKLEKIHKNIIESKEKEEEEKQQEEEEKMEEESVFVNLKSDIKKTKRKTKITKDDYICDKSNKYIKRGKLDDERGEPFIEKEELEQENFNWLSWKSGKQD
jgi:hypothetical protein